MWGGGQQDQDNNLPPNVKEALWNRMGGVEGRNSGVCQAGPGHGGRKGVLCRNAGFDFICLLEGAGGLDDLDMRGIHHGVFQLPLHPDQL